MSDITISQEEQGRTGRYIASVAGQTDVAELVYERLAPELLVAVHTGVPDSLGGRGVGKVLVERLVADARAQGFRVIPRCPFVAGQARRHPEWADVFTEA